MKHFSNKWISSKQARKQRKYRYNAPLHLRHKLISANVNKELRSKYGRSIPLRKGDKVKVMRGKLRGKEGKVDKINLKKLRVSIEGIQKQKKDGTKVNLYFNPSKLQIKELNLEDKERVKAIEKSREIIKQGEKKNPENKKFSGSLNSGGIKDVPEKK